MKTVEPRLPRLRALAEAVRQRPRIAAYLASDRRIPFSTDGIFRHYPELEAPARRKKAATRSSRRRSPKRRSSSAS
jgi:glutathione S-transferase